MFISVIVLVIVILQLEQIFETILWQLPEMFKFKF